MGTLRWATRPLVRRSKSRAQGAREGAAHLLDKDGDLLHVYALRHDGEVLREGSNAGRQHEKVISFLEIDDIVIGDRQVYLVTGIVVEHDTNVHYRAGWSA